MEKFPIKINELNQILNINFLRSKFTEQSNIKLGRYDLDLNSRILKQDEKRAQYCFF